MKKWILRIILLLVIILIAAGAYLFVSLNSIVKKQVETVAPQMTKTDVTLGSAKISPFSGNGQLSELFVGNPEGFTTPSAFKLHDIKVGLELSSLMSDTVVIKQIDIQQPEITFETTLAGNNLKKILDNLDSGSSETSTNQTSGNEKKFLVKDLVVNGAKINISALGKSYLMTLPEIHVQNIGTAENGVTKTELAKQILKPILVEVTKAATAEILKQGGDLKNVLGTNSVETINKTANDLKNIFKK